MSNYLKTINLLNYLRRIPKNVYINSLKKLYCTTPTRSINLKINNVNVSTYVNHLEQEYKLLKTQDALDPTQDKRILQLQPIINILEDYDMLIESIRNLQDLIDDRDQEIKKLAEEERTEFENNIEILNEKLAEALLPKDESDDRNSIMLEVNAGVGGQEAMLFAKELFEMYCSFADYKNWNLEIANYLSTDLGGIRHASALINGPQVFKYFKYEAGVHRVQRVPETEKSGRIHTSTVSVLAIPQPTDIEIKLDSKDLRIDTKRASGAGGQHVNTTDSAVRITYLPTGLSVECQVDRSQIKNRSLALQRLKALLYEQQLQAQMKEIESTKKSQVKSNFRNDKIRTYNYSQDRITDHRLQGYKVHNLRIFLNGAEQLEDLIQKLDKNARINYLLDIVNDFNNK